LHDVRGTKNHSVYLKRIGGPLRSYHGQYQDKILLNCFEVASVIVPSVGDYYGLVGAELVKVGFNAVMIAAGL
jgi:hypothetical protein